MNPDLLYEAATEIRNLSDADNPVRVRLLEEARKPDGSQRVSLQSRRHILKRLQETARHWSDPLMADALRGARTFALTLLIDADTNATEAEALVDEALNHRAEARVEASQQ